jgi:hypothetical protein
VAGVRWAVLGIVAALVGAGCSSTSGGTADRGPLSVTIVPSPSPFTRVAVGEVEAVMPDGWQAVPLDPTDGFRGGILASPGPGVWTRWDGSTDGLAATWVDATRVGVSSDLYYFAATGPLLGRLLGSERCHAEYHRVVLDRGPQFAQEGISPSDYVARGEGVCVVRGRPTRWAFFVAAPGFGPVRRLGIPASGLYVVVAVIGDSRRAGPVLHRMISRASFGGSSVRDLLAAARAAQTV